MILTNAQVVLPDGIRTDLAVEVRDGKIAGITHPDAVSEDRVDLGGLYLAPGFIDLHVHGGDGRDTMDGTADAFRAICDFHATGGTTSLLLTTVTAPLEQLFAVLSAVQKAITALPQMAGVHLEGPFLSKVKCGAQREDFLRIPDPRVTEKLLEFTDILKRVTLAPEIDGALNLIEALTKARVSVSGGHSDAWDEQARAGWERGMRSVTHVFNCMSSARHRDAYRVAGLLEFALAEPTIHCELIADGHHVSPTLMKMLYRAKGADGVALVTDATAGAGLATGAHFRMADTKCVVRDGACFLADGSALAGSAARMIDLVRTMINKVGLPIHEAIRMATSNPAREIGLKAKGRIEVGADADFVVLSHDVKVVRTIIGGRQVWPVE